MKFLCFQHNTLDQTWVGSHGVILFSQNLSSSLIVPTMPGLRSFTNKISSVFSILGRRSHSYARAQMPESPCSDCTEWNWDEAESTYSLVHVDIPEVVHNDALPDYSHIDEKYESGWIQRIRPLHQYETLETLKSPSSTHSNPPNTIFTRIRHLKFLESLSCRVSRVKECWSKRNVRHQQACPTTPTDIKDNFKILLEEEE
jgi:hypothetical protein